VSAPGCSRRNGRTQPDVLAGRSTPDHRALKRETDTIPIVFVTSRAIDSGFVQTLARPGGNTTGFTNFEVRSGQVAATVEGGAPALVRIAIIYNRRPAPFADWYLGSRTIGCPFARFADCRHAITRRRYRSCSAMFCAGAGEPYRDPGHFTSAPRYDHRAGRAPPPTGSLSIAVFHASGGLMAYASTRATRCGARGYSTDPQGAKPRSSGPGPAKFECRSSKTAKASSRPCPMLLARADEVLMKRGSYRRLGARCVPWWRGRSRATASRIRATPWDENDPLGRLPLLRSLKRLQTWLTDGSNVRMDLRWGRGTRIGYEPRAGVGRPEPTSSWWQPRPATVAVQGETRTIRSSLRAWATRRQRYVARLTPTENITASASSNPRSRQWLELLRRSRRVKRVAIMFNPDTAPVSAFMTSVETVARSSRSCNIAPVHSDGESKRPSWLGREPGGGLSPAGQYHVRHRVPIIWRRPEQRTGVYSHMNCQSGGLLSYGPTS